MIQKLLGAVGIAFLAGVWASEPGFAGEEYGACCFVTGACVTDFTPEECDQEGGWYLGDDVPCDPYPCEPFGACCDEEGDCTLTTAYVCAVTFGNWQGEGTDCDPNLCWPGGACCFDDGSCEPIPYESACEGVGGTYLGYDVPCDPNPCETTPVSEETWGTIKARYR